MQLAKLTDEATWINRERKRENLEFGGEIDKLNTRWRKAIRGILEVEIACAGLEEEVRELQRQAKVS